jgi:hypothetical protein
LPANGGKNNATVLFFPNNLLGGKGKCRRKVKNKKNDFFHPYKYSKWKNDKRIIKDQRSLMANHFPLPRPGFFIIFSRKKIKNILS